jgi:hypothetical protein
MAAATAPPSVDDLLEPGFRKLRARIEEMIAQVSPKINNKKKTPTTAPAQAAGPAPANPATSAPPSEAAAPISLVERPSVPSSNGTAIPPPPQDLPRRLGAGKKRKVPDSPKSDSDTDDSITQQLRPRTNSLYSSDEDPDCECDFLDQMGKKAPDPFNRSKLPKN